MNLIIFRRLLIDDNLAKKALMVIFFCASLSSLARATPLKSIGVTVSDLGNPFFARIGETVESLAKKQPGRIKVSVVSSAYDLQRQIRQIDSFIFQKVDLIVLTADHSERIASATQRARNAGIKVLAVDVTAEKADATITTDNLQAGRLACRFLAQKLRGKGNLVIINGPPVSSVRDRVQGCKEALKPYPRITILSDKENGGGSKVGGLEKMTNLLTIHANIDAVFAINDPTALGAEIAARQAERNNLVITGVDGSPAVVERLKDSSSLIAASSAQFPNRMAAKALEIGIQLLNGKRLAHSTILIPAHLVTKENVASYAGWK